MTSLLNAAYYDSTKHKMSDFSDIVERVFVKDIYIIFNTFLFGYSHVYVARTLNRTSTDL